MFYINYGNLARNANLIYFGNIRKQQAHVTSVINLAASVKTW